MSLSLLRCRFQIYLNILFLLNSNRSVLFYFTGFKSASSEVRRSEQKIKKMLNLLLFVIVFSIVA